MKCQTHAILSFVSEGRVLQNISSPEDNYFCQENSVIKKKISVLNHIKGTIILHNGQFKFYNKNFMNCITVSFQNDTKHCLAT